MGAASQRYLDKLNDEQEVSSHIADAVMEAYAMESILLRALKLSAGEADGITIDIARVYTNDAVSRVESSAKQALAIIAEGDLLKTYLAALRRFVKYMPVNNVAIRRRIAAKLVEGDGCNL